jgi:hypothetical protein
MFAYCTRRGVALSLAACFTIPIVSVVAKEMTTAVANDESHPLTATIRYASSHSDYIRENVRDFSCRLIKRERINGKLQSHQFANVKVLCERQRDDGTAQPLSVFMRFVAPKTIKDRRVLFVADQNDGMVLVRKGGSMMKNLKLKVDPFSDRARSESSSPITDMGFDKLIDRFVERAKADIDRDPDATNTQVTSFGNATVGERNCTHIRIVHPEQSQGMEYHMASLYIDNELHVPIRLVVHGWPEQEDDKPPVNEEYTYLNLKLNSGLTEADFSVTLLDNKYNPKVRTASSKPR